MNKISLLLLLLVYSHLLLGQKGYVNASLKTAGKNDDIAKEIKQYYLSNYCQQLSNQCIYGNTEISWKIDTSGNVIYLGTFLKLTPPLLEECLKKALFTTNGNWQPAILNGKKVKSELFFLKVSYVFNAACQSGAKPESYLYHLFSSYNKKLTSPGEAVSCSFVVREKPNKSEVKMSSGTDTTIKPWFGDVSF